MSTTCSYRPKKYVRSPTTEEFDSFFMKLSQAKTKPAILRVVPPHADKFVPKLSTTSFPRPIPDLYNPGMLHLDYIGLIEECERVYDSIKVHPLLYIYVNACVNYIDNTRSSSTYRKRNTWTIVKEKLVSL